MPHLDTKLNYETSQVRLPAGLAEGKVAFVEATVYDNPPLPFAIVSYEVAGKLQKLGLRFDLDKRAFLDDVRNASVQSILNECGPKVAAAIGQARRDRTPAARKAARSAR